MALAAGPKHSACEVTVLVISPGSPCPQLSTWLSTMTSAGLCVTQGQPGLALDVEVGGPACDSEVGAS